MRRRDWPTCIELGRQCGMNANHLRRLAAGRLASTRDAYRSRSASGQLCWRVNPTALRKLGGRVGAAVAAAKPTASSTRTPARAGVTYPINITVHVPEALLARLFGSGSKGS
ncbi:MAG TPA: hypothetical protein VF624_04170 [Tepidisphaeraceae bacterium]